MASISQAKSILIRLSLYRYQGYSVSFGKIYTF